MKDEEDKPISLKEAWGTFKGAFSEDISSAQSWKESAGQAAGRLVGREVSDIIRKKGGD